MSQLCECAYWCRDAYSENKGKNFPMSNHHPNCSEYVSKEYFRVRAEDGEPSAIFATEKEAHDFCRNDTEHYLIDIVQLTQDQFDKLLEFEGF